MRHYDFNKKINRQSAGIALEVNLRNPLPPLITHSDRTYVGTGPGPEWVTVYYVKPSHCNLCGNLNGVYV